MNKYLNKPIVIVVMLVAFFALTLLVSLRYSDNEPGKEKVKNSFLYRSAGWSVKLGEKIFLGEEEELVSETSAKSSDVSLASLKDFKKYVNFKRDENGLSLIMQNSEGVFFEKTWSIFKKSNKE